jgi:hypothetical protein
MSRSSRNWSNVAMSVASCAACSRRWARAAHRWGVLGNEARSPNLTVSWSKELSVNEQHHITVPVGEFLSDASEPVVACGGFGHLRSARTPILAFQHL